MLLSNDSNFYQLGKKVINSLPSFFLEETPNGDGRKEKIKMLMINVTCNINKFYMNNFKLLLFP